MPLHKDLTGADLHEPKGAASASAGQVYTADGAGSGTWSSIVIPSGKFVVNYLKFTSSGTWTKPSNLIGIEVTLIGGGGGGAVGFNLDGGLGGTSSFGSYVSAAGGNGGTTAGGGAGGTCNADINFQGPTGKNANIYIPPAIILGKDSRDSGGNSWQLSFYGAAGLGGSGGGAGGSGISWFTDTELTSSVSVTVGAGGASSVAANVGEPGIVIVKEFIKA